MTSNMVIQFLFGIRFEYEDKQGQLAETFKHVWVCLANKYMGVQLHGFLGQ